MVREPAAFLYNKRAMEDNMKTLVCHAGSSSLQCCLFEAEGALVLAEGSIDWSTPPPRLVVHGT
jgi:hypothetical protein